jgi:hypothetical protein
MAPQTVVIEQHRVVLGSALAVYKPVLRAFARWLPTHRPPRALHRKAVGEPKQAPPLRTIANTERLLTSHIYLSMIDDH